MEPRLGGMPLSIFDRFDSVIGRPYTAVDGKWRPGVSDASGRCALTSQILKPTATGSHWKVTMNFTAWVNLVGTVAGIVAAICWLVSAKIAAPNNIYTMGDELERMGRWNSYAAMAAVVASLCAAATFAQALASSLGVN
jgi:hypothetical protein